jgi:hypothetical protein
MGIFANPIALVSDGVNGALNWDGGIQAPPGFRPPQLLDPGVGNFNSVEVFSDNFGHAPRIHTWSATVQHEIGKYLIDISYQGNRGRRLQLLGGGHYACGGDLRCILLAEAC